MNSHDRPAVVLGVGPDRLLAGFAIAVSAGFLLCGYELLRSTSTSLFLEAYGAKRLPAVMALGPILTFALLWGYGRLLSVAGPRLTILGSCGFAAAVVLACFYAIGAGSRPAAGLLYAFREAYIVLLVEQVWSFINSTVRTDEGRKLNGPICGIASLGAILGGLLVKHLVPVLGTENLLLVAAASLVPTALCTLIAYQVGGEPAPAANEAHGRHGHLGLGTLVHEPTLRRLALLIALTQVVSTLADLQFSHYVELAFPIKDDRTRWLGGFYASLNGVAAFAQFVLTPLLLSLLSPRLIHAAIPLVHLGMAAAVIARPGLASAAGCYLVFKVLDYSLFRGVKELLYIPLSFDARYRAKEFIDAFVYRAAKAAASAGVAGIGWMVGLPLAVYPGLIAVALAGWFAIAHRLTRRRE